MTPKSFRLFAPLGMNPRTDERQYENNQNDAHNDPVGIGRIHHDLLMPFLEANG
jgi:hypothetical protein